MDIDIVTNVEVDVDIDRFKAAGRTSKATLRARSGRCQHLRCLARTAPRAASREARMPASMSAAGKPEGACAESTQLASNHARLIADYKLPRPKWPRRSQRSSLRTGTALVPIPSTLVVNH